MPFLTSALHCSGRRKAATARRIASSMASDVKASKRKPVPARRVASNSLTVSARPPVRRTMGTVP